MDSIALVTGPRSDAPSGVRAILRPSRTSRGSPKCLRSFASDALMAGCPTMVRSAARVTFASVSRACSGIMRLMSILRRSSDDASSAPDTDSPPDGLEPPSPAPNVCCRIILRN